MPRFEVTCVMTSVYQVKVEAADQNEAEDLATSEVEAGEHTPVNPDFNEATPTSCKQLPDDE
jgi:hypothetical protein